MSKSLGSIELADGQQLDLLLPFAPYKDSGLEYAVVQRMAGPAVVFRQQGGKPASFASDPAPIQETLARYEQQKALNEPEPHPVSQRFLAILDSLKQLHLAKAIGYGSKTDPQTNLRASEKFGVSPWIACLIRLNDKVHRLAVASQRELEGNTEPLPFESLIDNCDDIANYAIHIRMFLEERQQASSV